MLGVQNKRKKKQEEQKLPKIKSQQSYKKVQQQYEQILDDYKKVKIIQKNISLALDQIKNRYLKKQNMLLCLVQQTISQLRQIQNSISYQLDKTKQKQINLIQPEIYQFFINSKKIKKIINNNSQQHQLNLQKAIQNGNRILNHLKKIQINLHPCYQKADSFCKKIKQFNFLFANNQRQQQCQSSQNQVQSCQIKQFQQIKSTFLQKNQIALEENIKKQQQLRLCQLKQQQNIAQKHSRQINDLKCKISKVQIMNHKYNQKDQLFEEKQLKLKQNNSIINNENENQNQLNLCSISVEDQQNQNLNILLVESKKEKHVLAQIETIIQKAQNINYQSRIQNNKQQMKPFNEQNTKQNNQKNKNNAYMHQFDKYRPDQVNKSRPIKQKKGIVKKSYKTQYNQIKIPYFYGNVSNNQQDVKMNCKHSQYQQNFVQKNKCLNNLKISKKSIPIEKLLQNIKAKQFQLINKSSQNDQTQLISCQSMDNISILKCSSYKQLNLNLENISKKRPIQTELWKNNKFKKESMSQRSSRSKFNIFDILRKQKCKFQAIKNTYFI